MFWSTCKNNEFNATGQSAPHNYPYSVSSLSLKMKSNYAAMIFISLTVSRCAEYSEAIIKRVFRQRQKNRKHPINFSPSDFLLTSVCIFVHTSARPRAQRVHFELDASYCIVDYLDILSRSASSANPPKL